MKKYCENERCPNEAVTDVTVSVDRPSDQRRSLCATCQEAYGWGVQHGLAIRSPGLQILPPIREEGPESLYRVVYVIDVGGQDSHAAAQTAYEMMSDPNSMYPVLHILDADGRDIIVDLADQSPTQESARTSDRDARRFVADAATRCPKCHQENLDFGRIEIEGQSAFQEAVCQDCDTRFYAVYRLVGFGLQTDSGTEVHTIAEDFGEIQAPSEPAQRPLAH